ncbi:MAG: metallophosphoesterase [Coprobacter sp.]|nr:metallophosphoesterase [Coprobacter sp.]
MKLYLLPTLLCLLIIALTDVWIYYKVKTKLKTTLSVTLYWLPTALFYALFIGGYFSSADVPDHRSMYVVLWLLWLFLVVYFPKLFYVLFDLIGLFVGRMARRAGRVCTRIGLFVAVGVCVLFLYGAFIGRSAVHTEEVEISSSRLPRELDGLRIVQFSDAHIGNWGTNYRVLSEAVSLINNARPDIIVFTGDFVNIFATEITPEIKKLFRALDTPRYGKYAIMGNHDYGDYYHWKTPEDWSRNLAAMQEGIRDCGFDLLLNESRDIVVGDTSFLLIGVENTGRPPFRQYGNLSQSIAGADTMQYTILLSHDASHWRKEVLGHPFIDLTLSGHTHAAQCGIARGNIHWSPSSWIYDEWEGLYTHSSQSLYVNRGLGYVGIPLRIGMSPEITCITLRRK